MRKKRTKTQYLPVIDIYGTGDRKQGIMPYECLIYDLHLHITSKLTKTPAEGIRIAG